MLVNGSPTDRVIASDRGLAYGDGVFETIRYVNRAPILLPEHLARLRLGCERLSINTNQLVEQINKDIESLLKNLPSDCVVKVIVTRGEGARGYLANPQHTPTRIVSWSNYEADAEAILNGISVSLCQTRLGRNPALAGIKHLNRLEQVLGAAEIKEGCVEGIMQDSEGLVVECTRSNIFALIGGDFVTPSLRDAGVAGTLRAKIIEFTGARVRDLSLTELIHADEMLVCNSVFGIYPVRELAVNDDTHQYSCVDMTTTLVRTVEDRLGCRFS